MMLALLVAVVIVAGVIYVRTASSGRLLKGQVGNLLATGFRGEITLGEIDTSIRGALIIQRISCSSCRLPTRVPARGKTGPELNDPAGSGPAWTLQQLREAIPSDHTYRFIVHDRDAIFSTGLDASLAHLGLEVIETRVRTPKANSLCERLIGTLRRECLDWMIPLTEEHLRKTLRSWLRHYNRGRPHSSLGPGLPDPALNFRVHLQRRDVLTDQAELRRTRLEWTSSRVQPPGSSCMRVVEFCGRQSLLAP